MKQELRIFPVFTMDNNIKYTNSFQNNMFEFHISKAARDKYAFDETLFSFNGNVIFANFYAVRIFTQKLNEKREPSRAFQSGQINAMGLLDEIYHYILRQYEINVNPAVFTRAVNHLNNNLGNESLRKTLLLFVDLFPPVRVYKGEINSEDYLTGTTDGRSNFEITLEELMLLHFANFNPANKQFNELFDDVELSDKTAYQNVINTLDTFFRKEKPYGPDNQYIFDLLKAPINSNPSSLEDQLRFILHKWSEILDPKFVTEILRGMDLIKEDIRFSMMGGGGTPTIVPKYKGRLEDADFLSLGKSGYKYAQDSFKDYLEPERFTPDIDWMPKVVLLAKNIYVWLDQLSKKYGRYINRLDQIPDEELNQIANWNFTGLWLIGIWERSAASQKIKQMTGNPEAVSSAYSLFDYVIANELGGEEAFKNLDSRCRQRGIHLASDMVPNHMGIFSKWVIEHPEFFIQLPYPPFPNYKFTGYNLSDDPNIQLRIEDGYWSRTDASVVFQRIDNRTGETRYIYHGNDGTNMPWNDTAQLNLLDAGVREAVIQTIFHVARKTQIIRFDAAMTLTKRHFQRLWYPEPGTGGDIPSRADHGLTKDRFDELFPKEFWREVVDRINAEMPDTLLLAEAFWLMEGYFVRSLGMHRVYNSAFMHMMMKEENAKYRDVISNTLEYNPEILKRYVNFMSNPDEETAIKQFGVDDKYFGVCTLMVTLPGLPMFAHGQIEGYSEKYGMEYKKAYYNETPNNYLIDRHRYEVFPLMKKRHLFSQVTNFWFYDFHDNYGNLNENVYAFSNRYGDEKAIIIYNNKYEYTSGWINHSTGKAVPTGNGDEKKIVSTNLAHAIGINGNNNFFYIFRDHISNLEYIRTGSELHERGIFVELGAFKYHLFLDFREVYDESGDYKNLRDYLNGKGVPDVNHALKVLKFYPIHDTMKNLFEDKILEMLKEACIIGQEPEKIDTNMKFIVNRFHVLLNEISHQFQEKSNLAPIVESFRKGLDALKNVNYLLKSEKFKLGRKIVMDDFKKSITVSQDVNYNQNSLIYMLWLTLDYIGRIVPTDEYDKQSLELFDKFLLAEPTVDILRRLGRSDSYIGQQIDLLRILIKYYLFEIGAKPIESEEENDSKVPHTENNSLDKHERILLEKLLMDDEVKDFISANEYEGIWYYSKENLEDLIDWMFTLKVLNYFGENEKIFDLTNTPEGNEELKEFLGKNYLTTVKLKEVSKLSEYKLKSLYWNIVNS